MSSAYPTRFDVFVETLWGFPKIGVPLFIIPFYGIFSNQNHPYWSTPIYGNPQLLEMKHAELPGKPWENLSISEGSSRQATTQKNPAALMARSEDLSGAPGGSKRRFGG